MITLPKTTEQVELIKALASTDRNKAGQALEAFAAAVGPLLQTVISQEAIVSSLFKPFEFNEDEVPSLQFDLFYDIRDVEYFNIWSQKIAGGLAYNEVPGADELKFDTYDLYSAVAIMKKYARQGNVDHLAQGLNRLAQTLLAKKEFNAAYMLLNALAKASVTYNGVTRQNVIRSNSAGQLVLNDFNRLGTLASRILPSWNGGTPAGGSRSVTDMFFSPEGIEELKGMAFNPVNTRGSKTDIPGTEKMRNDLYSAGGDLEFYGVRIHSNNFLGVGEQYNQMFAAAAGATTFPAYGGSGAGAAFNPVSEQIAFGINVNANGLLNPIMVSNENAGTVVVRPDDQFVDRQKKIGFYAETNESYVVVDSRALNGIIF